MLGSGGTVGLCYHAGVLRALEEVGGFVPSSADLVVGTSAGSVVAAYLRSGWTTEEIWQIAVGVGLSPAAEGLPAGAGGIRVLSPAAASPVDLVRRGLGSALLVGRALAPVPAPPLPPALDRLPGGVLSLAGARRRLVADLPAGWPGSTLWLCAVDVATGRRVALGAEGAPPLDLPEAVMASCSIPGVYEPVRAGPMILVDGGVRSGTNLDLAVEAGCAVVICVAPMAFDIERPPPPHLRLLRLVPVRRLAREVAGASRRGTVVLVVRPSAAELRLHGLNLLRSSGWEAVASAAYEATVAALGTDSYRSALAMAA